MHDVEGLHIRACREGDLGALESSVSSRGRTKFHVRRFRQQQAGESTYLIAWLDGKPVGHVNVRWIDDDALARYVPTCPELNALGVTHQFRSRGVGTALIEAGEALVRSRGFQRVALGVGLGNERAASLYARLSYQDWGHGRVEDRWTWIDQDGVEHEEVELCTWLVKDLER